METIFSLFLTKEREKQGISQERLCRGLCAVSALSRYENGERIVSEETSKIMQRLLESVVSEGSGKNAYVEGYAVGGKTATSQTLPRSANKYISSFIGFAPADDPQVLGMCVIDNPKGIYYGGTIAAPVIGNIFENIFPYLGIEKEQEMQYTREG